MMQQHLQANALPSWSAASLTLSSSIYPSRPVTTLVLTLEFLRSADAKLVAAKLILPMQNVPQLAFG